MKKYFFFLYAVGFLMLGGSLASAATTTLSTYYPAPNGNYNKLTTNTEGIGTAAPNAGSGYALVVAATAGKVGIGTTTPGAKLTVTGFAGASGAMSTTFQTNAGALGTTIGNELVLGSIGGTTANSSALGIRLEREASGSDWTTSGIQLAYDVDNTPRAGAYIELSHSGNVGIGTTVPGAKLSVQDSTNTQYYQLRLGYIDGTYDFGIGRRPDNGALQIQGTQAGYNNILLAPTSGNVGIGTTGPSYPLQVNGDIYANGGWLRVSGNNGLYFQSYGGGWYMTDSSWIRSYNGKYVYMAAGFDTGSPSGVGCGGGLGGGYMFQTCGSIYANGGYVYTNYAGIGSYLGYGGGWGIVTWGSIYSGNQVYAASDQRLKKNILPITGALDKVQRLNGVTFTWKKTGKKDIGVIAQNVEKVLPEIVKAGPDGMKAVEYGNLTALLIEAIKEQQKEIKAQQKEIEGLEKKLAH